MSKCDEPLGESDETHNLVMANSSITTFLREMQSKTHKLHLGYKTIVSSRGPTYRQHADNTFLQGTDRPAHTYALMVGALHRLYQMWERRLSWVGAEDFVKFFHDRGVVTKMLDMRGYTVKAAKECQALYNLMPNETFRNYELLCPTVTPSKLKRENGGVSDSAPVSGDSVSISGVAARPMTNPGLGGETPKRRHEEPPCDQPLAKRQSMADAVDSMIPFSDIRDVVLATLRDRGKPAALLASLSAVPFDLDVDTKREIMQALYSDQCDDSLCNRFVEAMTAAACRELLS